jgi:hypothetical protein
MDVETTQAIGTLGTRVDGLETHMNAEFADVRGEMRTGFADVRLDMRTGFANVRAEMRAESAKLRAEIVSLRQELRTGLESNWSRTQTLFECLRGDVQMLAGHVADLASRLPRS